MEKEIVARKILKTAYLTLKECGYPEVSLKSKDLLEYAPQIEETLKKKI